MLLPPINGATAASGTPYFTENPGDKFKAWDTQLTFDYMPSQYVTFRAEFTYRHASVPYFAGPAASRRPVATRAHPARRSPMAGRHRTSCKPSRASRSRCS